MSSYIEMQNISKVFPPNTVALNNCNLSIDRGEIHALIGENGAGKSTIVKIMYGLEQPSDGIVKIDGKETIINSPTEAVALKIGMVHQELMLIEEFTVLENIVLGNEPTNGIALSLKDVEDKAREVLELLNFSIPLNRKVADVSVSGQQKIEIAKQLYRNADFLILDEPTALLTPQETVELFKILKELRDKGKTIIFISHKLDEVLEISDRISVMRKGEIIWTKDNDETVTQTELANAMVGRNVLLQVEKTQAQPGKVVLSLENFSSVNSQGTDMKVNQVDMEVREREILGIAAVEGNGQYNLVNAIVGTLESTGKMFINDVDVSRHTINEKRAMISYVSQDRKLTSSSQEDSLIDNTFMTHHYANNSLFPNVFFINKTKMKEFNTKILEKYQVNTNNGEVSIGSLSGGNQQKVIIGREFELDTPLLIVDQPVRGIDVGSIEYIHNSIVKKRDAGDAVLLFSADLDELFSLADRILVMYKGKIVTNKLTSNTNREEIGQYMLGVKSDL